MIDTITPHTIHNPIVFANIKKSCHELIDIIPNHNLPLATSITQHAPHTSQAWSILLRLYTLDNYLPNNERVPIHHEGELPEFMNNPKNVRKLNNTLFNNSLERIVVETRSYRALCSFINHHGGNLTLLEALYAYPHFSQYYRTQYADNTDYMYGSILEYILRHGIPGTAGTPHRLFFKQYARALAGTLTEYVPYAAEPWNHPAVSRIQKAADNILESVGDIPSYRYTVSTDTINKTFDYYRYEKAPAGFVKNYLTGTGHTLNSLQGTMKLGPTAFDKQETYKMFNPIMCAVCPWLGVTDESSDEKLATAAMVSIDLMLHGEKHPHPSQGGLLALIVDVQQPWELLESPYAVYASVRNTYYT